MSIIFRPKSIITGLAGATVLVLFVIPVGYYYLKRSTQHLDFAR